MKGLPYILFLIRAAGPVGDAHAEALARMLFEDGDGESAKRILRAIETPFTDLEKTALLKPNGIVPSDGE